VVGAILVTDENDFMLVSDAGTQMRVRA